MTLLKKLGVTSQPNENYIEPGFPEKHLAYKIEVPVKKVRFSYKKKRYFRRLVDLLASDISQMEMLSGEGIVPLQISVSPSRYQEDLRLAVDDRMKYAVDSREIDTFKNRSFGLQLVSWIPAGIFSLAFVLPLYPPCAEAATKAATYITDKSSYLAPLAGITQLFGSIVFPFLGGLLGGFVGFNIGDLATLPYIKKREQLAEHMSGYKRLAEVVRGEKDSF